jgi:hypothetical protein
LTAETTEKRLSFRRTTLKGLLKIILFFVATIIIEIIVVVNASNRGTEDYLLQWSFTFPGTNWTPTIAMSILFGLVPIAVIISLMASWTYLAGQMAVQPSRQWAERTVTLKKKKEGVMSSINSSIERYFHRITSRLLKTKSIAYIRNKIHSARATLKSALIVLLVFILIALASSLLAYPTLIYESISSVYRNNPALLGFIKATGSVIGSALGFINVGLISVASGFRSFAFGVGSIFKPIADLDNAGKYLLIQNTAAWISAFFAVFYAEYSKRSYRRRKFRRG